MPPKQGSQTRWDSCFCAGKTQSPCTNSMRNEDRFVGLPAALGNFHEHFRPNTRRDNGDREQSKRAGRDGSNREVHGLGSMIVLSSKVSCDGDFRLWNRSTPRAGMPEAWC